MRSSMSLRAVLVLAAAVAILGLSASPAHAASASAGLFAPPVDGADIANLGFPETLADKWWNDTKASGATRGQTFTTGSADVLLNAITYQIVSSQKAEPTKTYVIRVGTYSGSTFTEIYRETAVQTFTWNASEYMTWAFDSPVFLSANSAYAIDVAMLSSTSDWPTGIPYLSTNGNTYAGGAYFTSGGSGVGNSIININTSYDRVFHLDMMMAGALSAYWDLNGAAAGACITGNTAPGTWGADTNWNAASDGTGTGTAAWAAGQVAKFAAGGDATGTYDVTVDGTQDIGGLIFQEGTVTLKTGTAGALRITANTSVDVAGGLTARIETPISDDTGGRQLIKIGNGTLVLAGDNSAATGGMAIYVGATQFESPASINGTARNVTVTSPGAVVFGASFGTIQSSLTGRIVNTSTGAIAADNHDSESLDFSSAGANFTAASLGAVGNVTYTGTLTPNETTYRLGGGGGTLTMDGNNGITGANALTVVGPGTVVLSAANDHTLGTTLNADGTLLIGDAGALGSGALTIAGGAVGASGTAVTTNAVAANADFSIAGTGALTLGGTMTLNANRIITNNDTTGTTTFGAISGATRTLTFSGNGNTAVTGIIGTTTGTLTKNGTGVLTLSGANTYTGATAINGGTLALSGANGSILTTGSIASIAVGTTAGPGGAMTLDNASANNTNRVPDASTLTLNNGTINFIGNATAASTETIGAITAAKGANLINLSGGASGKVAVLTSTAGAITRTAGATLNIIVANGTSQQFKFTGGSAGINKGVFFGATAANDFAYYPGAGAAVVAPTYGSGDFATPAATLTASKHNKLSGNDASQAAVSIYSLNMPGNYGITALTGNLTFSNAADKGAIIKSGGGAAQIGTAGDANDIVGVAAGELVINTVAAGDNLTLNVGITATTTALTKTGAGTLTLTANRDYLYTGATNVNAGTLVLNSLTSAAAGGFRSNVTINNGGTAKLGASNKMIDTAVFTVNAGGTLDLAGYSDSIGALGGSGSVTNSTGTSTLSLASGTQTFSGVIGGSGLGITVSGATETLSGANTYTGPTTLTGGTLSVGASNNLGAAASNLVFDGGTLQVTGTSLTSFSGIGHAVSFNSGKTVGLDIAAIFVADQVLNQGAGGLTKLGAGTLVLNQANTYTGATTLTAGSLRVETADNLGDAASNLVFNGGTLQVMGTTLTSLSGIGHTVVYTAGKLVGLDINNAANTFTADQVLSQTTGGLTKWGDGTLVLNQANTYTGVTTLAGGVMSVSDLQNAGTASNIGAYAAAGAAGLVLNPNQSTATLRYTGGNTTTDRGFTLSSNTTIDVNQAGTTLTLGNCSLAGAMLTVTGGAGSSLALGAVTLTGAATLNPATANLTVASVTATNQNLTLTGTAAGNAIAGAITTGTGGLTVSTAYPLTTPTGTWTLSGANTYSGTTTVNAGTLRLAGSNSSAGATTISGGTLQLASATNNGLASGTLNLNGGTIDPYDGSRTVTNNVVLGGTATVAGAYNLEFGTGTFTNSGGDRTLTNNLDSGKILTLSGQVKLSEHATTGRTLTLSGTGETLISGQIVDGGTGAGGLTKNGAGQSTLSGTNTYSGTTTVNAGTLAISGSPTTSGVTAVMGGTLRLDYGTNDSSKLADANSLVFGGGTLDLSGGTHVEVVGSTTLAAGVSNVTRTGGAKLAMGAIAPAGGAINFGADNIATTTNPNDSGGILGAWATVGASWAANDGGGNIVAYAGAYADIDARGPSSTIADDATGNVRIVGDGTGGNIALGAATTSANTLLQTNANHAATVDTADKTLRTGGVKIGSGAEALTIGASAGDGTLKAAAAGTTLYLINNNPAKTLTVNAAIADNTSASGLGTIGNVTLNGANTYTGTTVVGPGTLTLGHNLALQNSVLDTSAGGVVALTVTSPTLGGLKGGTDLASLITTGYGSVTSLTLNPGAGVTSSYSGVIADGAPGMTLIKTGAGTQILSGECTYTGKTTISEGVLKWQNTDWSFWTQARDYTIASGAVMELDGEANIPLGTSTIDGAGTLRISGGDFWPYEEGDFLVLAMGSGGLIDVRAGAGLYNGWDLTPNAISWTANLASLNVDSGCVLDVFSGNDVFVDALTGAGTVHRTSSLGGGQAKQGSQVLLTVGVNNGSGTFSGVISNASANAPLAFAKTGSGTQTLTGTNTYAGPTSVSAGTLVLAGTGALTATSSITVNGPTARFMQNSSVASDRTFTLIRGTLGGTGTINTPITSGSNVIIAPGDRTLGVPEKGVLTIANAVNLIGGTTEMRLFSIAANDSDMLMQTTTGGLTYGGILDITAVGTLAFAVGNHWDLFDFVSQSGTFSNDSDFGTVGGTYLPLLSEGQKWSFNYVTGVLSVALGILPGDTNLDGVVDAVDYIAIKTNFGLAGTGITRLQGDLIDNDVVDWDDLQQLMNAMATRSIGGAPATPEPATLGLLAIGALALLRRRRRA